MAKSITSPSAAINKTPRASRSKKPADQALVLNHTETIEGDDALDSLINELNGDVVIEPTVALSADAVEAAPGTSTETVDDSVLDSVVSSAEATEVMMAAATPEGVADGAAAPTGSASDVTADEVVAKVKKTATPRKHYSDKTERLKDKLGSGLGDYTVLTLADAEVDDEALKAKMEETLVIIKAMNKKEQNWAVKFIEYLAGKKSSLSEVTARTLKVLQRDGFITTGNEGNVFKDLVSRPYSPGAARAMGGNNLGMLADLKVILADGKGRYVANNDSLLLMKVNSMMAAPAAA